MLSRPFYDSIIHVKRIVQLQLNNNERFTMIHLEQYMYHYNVFIHVVCFFQFALNFADLISIPHIKDFVSVNAMEDICHSVSKIIHKMPKPSKKAFKAPNSKTKPGKVVSSPNLLQLPSEKLQQSATTQKRSKSTSHIADKEHPTLNKVSPSESTDNIKCRMQNNGVENNSVDLQEKPIYQNEVFANDTYPKKITGKQKKSPPKRPPPPKVLPERYQNSVYANLHRSKSESQMDDIRHVYANFDDGKLDIYESKTVEDLNLYINQVIQKKEPENDITCNQYEEIMTQSLGETYISMTGNDDDIDENGYVTMSRDRSLTS